MSDLDLRQFDLRRLRQEAFDLNECPNGPDEDGSWPCDPKPAYGGGIAECQVCGRVGSWAADSQSNPVSRAPEREDTPATKGAGS